MWNGIMDSLRMASAARCSVSSLVMESSVFTGCFTRFNAKKFDALPTECIGVFLIISTTNHYDFPQHH